MLGGRANAFAQQGYDIVFHKTYAERSLLFDTLLNPAFIDMPPADFRMAIAQLEERAKSEGDYGAELEVLFTKRIYDDQHGLTNADKRIAEVEEQIGEIDKKKYKEYVIRLMHDLGNNYAGQKHNYVKAFEYYMNVYDMVSRMSAKDFPDKKFILVDIANRYYRLGDYGKAKDLLLMADTLGRSSRAVTDYNTYNTLGLVYRSTGVYDSAVHCFEKAYALAQRDSNDVWCSIINGNIGITYYMAGKYDEAKPLLYADVEGCLAYGPRAYDNGMHSLTVLADIHLKEDSIVAVEKDLAIARQYVDSVRDKVKLLSELYPLLARYYYRTGNAAMAYRLQDSANVYKDSIRERDNIYLLAKAEYHKDIEKRQAELDKLVAEKKYVEFMRNGLLVVVILLFIIGLLAINRQRLRHILKQNRYLADKKLAERELENATRQLTSYTHHLQEKNALIDKSAQEIERLQSRLSDVQKQRMDNEVLQQLYASTILTDEEWDEFKLLFEQVHEGFLQRLKDKMPGLSPADTRFLVLSKLKLSNKEMAGILGVQPDTIRTYKHRLRKKYDLPEDDDITGLVDAI